MDFHIKNCVGKNIKSFRIYRNLSQENLTAKLNILGLDIDRSALSRIENQQRELYDYEIFFLSKALEISIESLFKDIDLIED